MHDWTLSAALVAKVLADKGYHYQFMIAKNAKHVDRLTVAQTLPYALEWVWKGYRFRSAHQREAVILAHRPLPSVGGRGDFSRCCVATRRACSPASRRVPPRSGLASSPLFRIAELHDLFQGNATCQ